MLDAHLLLEPGPGNKLPGDGRCYVGAEQPQKNWGWCPAYPRKEGAWHAYQVWLPLQI